MASIFDGLLKNKELEGIIFRLEANMSNNYKDNAQDNLKELIAAFDEMKNDKVLKEKSLQRYSRTISEYQSKMEGYSHKEQKPYWFFRQQQS